MERTMNYDIKYIRQILVGIFIIVPLVSNVLDDVWDITNPIRVLKQAQELALDGQYEKALRRFQWIREWFHQKDHFENLSDVVLYDNAINGWCKLCNDFPKARQ